ncbi:hypothetical protein X801_01555 [Opisthorchis viverrini]|uniref:Uncharacterized protein n=1 Tax=Opisthorchis viverrini TaxID=6198 RepID=A0A1S8X730_OPIVI|nr:hypothetical protein X801_01555 [Opisthorchis viverrini]
MTRQEYAVGSYLTSPVILIDTQEQQLVSKGFCFCFIRQVTCVDAATSTSGLSTVTEPDPLGPCEAGTKVVVEGVVWLETAGTTRPSLDLQRVQAYWTSVLSDKTPATWFRKPSCQQQNFHD